MSIVYKQIFCVWIVFNNCSFDLFIPIKPYTFLVFAHNNQCICSLISCSYYFIYVFPINYKICIL